ncbi:MAG: transglutaminase domain-containing protein, partial [Candidatus Aenigmatarchaeota archaeon]
MKYLPLLILLLIGISNAIYPSTVDSIELKVIYSGSLITNNVESVNLSIYIPQEGVQRVDVNANYRYIFDEFGNRLVLLEWSKPKGTIDYNIEVVVRNNAKQLDGDKKIGDDSRYLKETNTVVINDEIRRLAYPYEKSLQKAAEMTILTNNLVKYDISLSGQRKPSDWVLVNRRGVCAEYSSLLLSLLRASGIPARYVAGYAYSGESKKFIGHAWVEVLTDGGWIPFDATWLQAGYLDATHIKTSSLIDGNQTDKIVHRGGSIDWKRNDEKFEIINYQEKNITDISISSESFSINGYGYIAASVQGGCSIAHITVKSCTSEGDDMLNIYDSDRKFWFCGKNVLYWFFSSNDLEKDFVYTCPVAVFDQIRTKSIAVELTGIKKLPDVFISGPSTAGINEPFKLEASADGIFYSPNFTLNNGKTWDLKIAKPGVYKFYLYFDGAVAEKSVSIIERKEFSLSVVLPINATESFFANITANNLLSDRNAKLRV